MADKKSNDKSTWLFRPASPDALSKKLKKCKTRKERQMAVFNDNFEREERIRMERALVEAEKAAKQAQADAAQTEYIRQHSVDFWDQGWLEEITAKLAREERSVRPKTVRPERAVLVKPEEPRLMTHMYKKYKNLDPKKIKIERVPGGVQYTREDGLIPGAYAVDANGKETEHFYLNDKWIIYQQLKLMDLDDPKTKEAIIKACTTQEKEKPAETASENSSEMSKSAKKRLFKKK
jgi:hypothetical protein